MRVNREFVFAAVADERRQIATLIDELDDAQLATDSLCAGWDVKTVAAHLVSVFADSFWVFQWTALRHGGIHRAIDELARRRAQLPASEIAAGLRQGADRELSPPITGPLSGLTDVLVHGGDIRIPLGLPFEPDTELVLPRARFSHRISRVGIRAARTATRDSSARQRRRPVLGSRAPKSGVPWRH